MNIIFQIDGGLGKSIMATAVVKAIKSHYKNANLIVVTAYTDVFLNNPNIHEIHRSDQINGLYLKYIKDKECKVLIADPYRDSDFIIESPISVLSTWCKLYDVPYNNEQPEIYLTQPEIDYFSPYYKTEKPILAIQPHGGPEGIGYQYSWPRDIPKPTMESIINHYKNDYTIIHIKRSDQIIYPDTLQGLDGFRSIAILLSLSSKRLLIDSFAQHLASALNLKCTVCWVNTKPEMFGYSLHDNIKANPFTKEIDMSSASYGPFALSEPISNIPYNDLKDVFNLNTIINSINNQ